MKALALILFAITTAPAAEHWAYVAPQRPALPKPGHPIDVFIEQQLGDLPPAPPADPGTWLRRVYLDLTGLPPTPAQRIAFLADSSPEARARIIDALLADPGYGERWGRHWMDVWRYSDWDGYKQQLRGSQRFIWHWRDWIIESLNADKGYDRMVQEMLAGDELAPTDRSVLRATGYLARNYHNRNRNIWLDATVEHTAKAFLGLTMNCARCHDHKADPISQEAYFQMRAIFEPHRVRTDPLPGELDPKTGGFPRAYDAHAATNTYFYVEGDEKKADHNRIMQPGIPELFGKALAIQPVPLPLEARQPALQDFVLTEQQAKQNRKVKESSDAVRKQLKDKKDATAARATFRTAKAARDALEARIAAYRAQQAGTDPAEADRLAAAAARAEAELQLFTAQGNLRAAEKKLAAAESEQNEKKRKAATDKAGKEVKKAKAAVAKAEKTASHPGTKYRGLGTTYPAESTGRRLAFARWITAPDNSLAARVAVNHIWLRHFGSPLVDRVFDFGISSPRPRHAELLDWLAVEFMEQGWSMKHLHRLILSSEAWGRASALPAGHPLLTEDPDNLRFGRARVRRLEAEVVRDGILHVAGALDRSRGGPDIDATQGEKVYRRSVYFRHAYEKQMLMLTLFDPANPTDCYRRSNSITPQQALALSNSGLCLSMARKLARTLWAQAPERFIATGFETVLGRLPDAEERAACHAFLEEQGKLLTETGTLSALGGTASPALPPSPDPAMRARENLVHVLLNHNDFVMIR